MKEAMSIDPENFESLRQKFLCGEITSITFDTQIFDRNGRTFRGGLLGQLRQLKNSNIKLLITELVYDEAKKHMLAMHKEKDIKLEAALSKFNDHLSSELLGDIQEELSGRMTPENIVFHEFNDFFLATDAEIISYDETSTRDLFKRYFKSEPPFHKDNSKKSEFPDAVALMCLEKHAKINGVLVVSSDNDWLTFCRRSESGNLHCVPDLSTALTLMHSVKDDIKDISEMRRKKFREFTASGALHSAIVHDITKKLKGHLIFTGRTSYFYTALCVQVDIISFKHSEDTSFGIITDNSNLTAWVLSLDFECRIQVNVTFNSDDDSYVGASQYERSLIVPSTSIINVTNENISVETIVDNRTTLDLGAIAPGEHHIEVENRG